MDSVKRLVISYFGKFTKNATGSWVWNGKDTKSLLVTSTISYTELYDKVQDFLNVNCLTHKIVMQFVVPGMIHVPISPVEILSDDDLHWFISIHEQVPLCISLEEKTSINLTPDVEPITIGNHSSPCVNDTLQNSGIENVVQCLDVEGRGVSNHVLDIDQFVVIQQNYEELEDGDINIGSADNYFTGYAIVSDAHQNVISASVPNSRNEKDIDDLFQNSSENEAHVFVPMAMNENIVGTSSSRSKKYRRLEKVGSSESFDDESDVQVDQLFRNKRELQSKLHMLALRKKFEFKVKKSNKSVISVVCVDDSCKWNMRATKLEDSDYFQVRKYTFKHTCSLDFRHNGHRQASSWAIGQHIKSRLQDLNQSYKPSTIIGDIRREFGINLSYRKAWKAKEHALELIRGSPEDSYGNLASYCYILEKNNPGTTTYIQTDKGDRFLYFFLSLGPSIRGFHSSMRPVICVDGTFLKCKYKGTLIVATCQDANGQIYPIAWGIVDSENDSSWSWFMSKLKEQIGDSNRLVFISDRHKSITKAIRVIFPQSHHGYCIWHMEQNIKVKFHTKGLIPLFKSAAEAYRMSEFENYMTEIYGKNEKLGKYLEDTGYDSWSRVHFKGNRYNIMTSNNAESMNSLLKSQRDYPITALIEHIRSVMQKWFYERSVEAEACTTQLTPKLEESLRKTLDASSILIVNPIAAHEFQVGLDKTNMDVVNIAQLTCSCKKFDILEIPCRHALVAAISRGISIYSLCSEYYRTTCWRISYAEPIHPVDNQIDWLIPEEVQRRVILPPCVRRSCGRPRTRRIRSTGEISRMRHCSTCGSTGHNKKSCKNSAPILT
ncbi:uncharacterized protein [Primulina huaijiensis]|uniref:uncharacterized protein n=1 Tax=Primulina huaijiensis TaxID=1492673 RepID=UPI003CC70614